MIQKIICFDIGKSKIAQAVIEINGENSEYDFLDFQKVENPVEQSQIEKSILDYCRQAREKFKTQDVGIASAKIVDSEKKEVFNAKDVYGTETFSFNFLEKENFNIRTENDGYCFVQGENIFGEAKNKKSVLALTVGTQIGGGFIDQGNNFKGANYSGMEVSHIKICLNEKWLNWHELVGGESIEQEYKKRTGKALLAKEIFKLQDKKDEATVEIIRSSSEFLGVGIANLINILDPEGIIIGGSLANQEDFIKKSFEIAQKNIFNKKAEYQFRTSVLKEKANLLGAAWQYFI